MIRPALLICLMAPAQAGAFDLGLPIDCVLGETCFIQQFVDHDHGPAATDFTCGSLSYDTHSGTDFALLSDQAMQAGVAVLAAAPGRVAGVRDGVPDIRVSDPAAPPLNGRDCGNGVLVDHAEGWQTQYCHLKRGSVLPAIGDTVARGEVLGQVGLSGNTEFPHLHITLRRNGATVDPFAPDLPASSLPASGLPACGTSHAEDLWTPDIPYVAGGFVNLGIASAVPDFAAIQRGLPPETLSRDSPALVLWAQYYGNRAGDVLHLAITGPDGPVVDQMTPLDRTQARAFRANGRRMPAAGWPAGTYTGSATLLRAGTPLDSAEVTLTLP